MTRNYKKAYRAEETLKYYIKKIRQEEYKKCNSHIVELLTDLRHMYDEQCLEAFELDGEISPKFEDIIAASRHQFNAETGKESQP